MVAHGFTGRVSAVVTFLERERAGQGFCQDSEAAASAFVRARGVIVSMVHVGLLERGCLLWLCFHWLELALGNLDHPLAVDLDGGDLHQSNVYEREVMDIDLDIVHQSIRGEAIACGANINQVVSTSSCAHVTCWKCRVFIDDVTSAVFQPLTNNENEIQAKVGTDASFEATAGPASGGSGVD